MNPRNSWVPVTPEKPLLQRSNNVQPQMPQNRLGTENWNELLGIYLGSLQNDQSIVVPQMFHSNMERRTNDVATVQTHINHHQQQIFNPIRLMGQNYARPNVQNISSIETDPGLSLNGDLSGILGLNRITSNVQDVYLLNQRATNVFGQNTLPQNVDSLAELLTMRSTVHHPVSSPGPSRSNYIVNGPTGFNESREMTYMSAGAMLKDQAAHASHDVGGWNLQQTTYDRLMIPYQSNYTPNLPPRSEASPSSAATGFMLGPFTPDQQKQSTSHLINKESYLLITDMPSQEKHENAVVLAPQPQVLENEQDNLMVNTQHPSILATSASINEKSNPEGGNIEIDLEKTPPQKPPKRRKIRPKVVVEGKKPKRTPKPATPKAKTPTENPRPKRKYVRKKGVESSATPSTETSNLVEASSEGPATKSCRRALNFDLNNEAEKESYGGDLDHQTDNHEENKVSDPPNLFSHDVEQTREYSRVLASAAMEGHQNTYRNEEQTKIAYSSVPSIQKVISEDSAQPAFAILQPTPKSLALNTIARRLNVQSASVDRYNQVNNNVNVPHAQCATRENNSEPNIDRRRHQPFQILPHVVKDMDIERGSTKDCSNLGRIESREKTIFPAESSTVYQNGGSIYPEDKGQSCSRNVNAESSKIACCWYTGLPKFGHKFHQQLLLSQMLSNAEQIAQNTCRKSGNEQTNNSMVAVTANHYMTSEFSRATEPSPRNENTKFSDRVPKKKRTAKTLPTKKVAMEDRSVKKEMKKSKANSSKKLAGSEEKSNPFSIEYITDRFRFMRISTSGNELALREENALVPYRGDGAVVLFDPVKKRIPRPRVELDPETNRLWNLLMGKDGSENADTMDADKQKWWEEERKIVRGRVDSFIARMHLVQGDRRFSKWKGSVVDSVIGVFLTQNVSDHLSSSAFMSLAAKFPAKSTNVTEPGREAREKHQEVRITYPDGTSYDKKITIQPASNHSSVTSVESSEQRTDDAVEETMTFLNDTKRTEDDIVSSQSSVESSTIQNTEDIRSGSGSISEAEDGHNFRHNNGVLNISKQAEVIDAQNKNHFQFMGSSLPHKRDLVCHQQVKNPEQSCSDVNSDAFISNYSNHHKSVTYTNSWANLLMGLKPSESNTPTVSRNESKSYLDTAKVITSRPGDEHASNSIGLSTESSLLGIQNRRVNYRQNLRLPQDNTGDYQSIYGCHFTKHFEGGVLESVIEESASATKPTTHSAELSKYQSSNTHKVPESVVEESASATKPTTDSAELSKYPSDNQLLSGHMTFTQTEEGQVHSSAKLSHESSQTETKTRKRKEKEKAEPVNWDTLREQVETLSGIRERNWKNMDTIDYEALRNADVREISDAIKERGMNNMLAERIKDFLNRLARDHGKVELEWLRDVQPDKAKDYLLSIRGLGLKSVECVRLLTLHHLAFPVDTNVGRIAVRLGWVPLQPLPESLQLHLLELYPVLESIQKYLWPRLCKLDQETLYELHYQMITFGKVFCTKRDPNCNACPMRAECRHFASAFASARLALPATEEKRVVSFTAPITSNEGSSVLTNPMLLTPVEDKLEQRTESSRNCEPRIEEPTTPEQPVEISERDIEDFFYEDPDEIPVIKLNVEEFANNLQSFMQENMELGEADMSKALVALDRAHTSIPVPKLKNISRLRTEHQVYELPDSHPLLKEMDRREPDDPSPYLLAIWTPGETADSVNPPEISCSSQEGVGRCNNNTCFSCNSAREAQAQTVRGTILVPCRTAMRGSFPLNGTYFQVNEVFADHDSSINPIDVPRSLLWNLPRRTVFFGTSVTTIFKGMSTEDIQFCFWKGFVCVRGFDQKTRAPRPLRARLHFPTSKMAKKNE